MQAVVRIAGQKREAEPARDSAPKRPVIGSNTVPAECIVPPSGVLVLIESDDRIKLVDGITKELLWVSFKRPGFERASYCHTTNCIYVTDSSHDSCLQEWNLNLGLCRHLDGSEKHNIRVINSAGTLMVTGEVDSRLVVWDLDTRTHLFDVDIGNDYEIQACFTSSGDICVLVYEKQENEVSHDDAIYILESDTGRVKLSIDIPAMVRRITPSSMGQLLAVILFHGVAVFNVTSSATLFHKEIREVGEYTCFCSFGPDDLSFAVIYTADDSLEHLTSYRISDGTVIFDVALAKQYSQIRDLGYSVQRAAFIVVNGADIVEYDSTSGIELQSIHHDDSIKHMYLNLGSTILL
jgi:WD40 repeat protein